jgi:hypothetical protein
MKKRGKEKGEEHFPRYKKKKESERAVQRKQLLNTDNS